MTKRKILTESQARDWFKRFGEELGKSFDEIYGDMDLSKNSQTTAMKSVGNTLFIKIKMTYVGYLIIPQLDML